MIKSPFKILYEKENNKLRIAILKKFFDNNLKPLFIG